jgi:23S rRNA (guanine1835-N2)-methyltransferase
MTDFICRTGSFRLERRPRGGGRGSGGPLLAHDAADALLVEHVGDDPGDVLVVNDGFGALGVAMHAERRTSWTDSVVTHLATADNLVSNGLPVDVVNLPSTEAPIGAYATVLWRLPRSVDVLHAQTAAISGLGARRVLAGGMDKHLPPTFLEYLRRFGTVVVHPGRRKAHVYEVSFWPTRPVPSAVSGATSDSFDALGFTLTAGPHVFGGGGLDAGTALLAGVLDQTPSASVIADLCCGTGVLGLFLQRLHPSAVVHYFDESYQAVASARANVAANVPEAASAFHPADGFGDVTTLFDLIVCNPPFHQGNVVTDNVAIHLFRQARQRLRQGGELWIVGNRHLDYHGKLRHIFPSVRQVAASSTFVVLAAGPQRS